MTVQVVSKSARLLVSSIVLSLLAIPVAADSESRFITLGTNSGPIPNPARAEASNVLTFGDEVILLDAGDAVAWQLSKVGIGLDKVGSIFFTHLHFDHTGGLFAFLSQRFQVNVQGVITIYGPEGTKRTVDGIIQAMQPVTEDNGWMLSKLQPKPSETIKVVELTHGATLKIGEVKITTSKNSHFVLAEEDGDTKVRTLSYRFDLPDRSIVYTGDTGPSEEVIALSQGVDMLVTEVMDAEISLQLLNEKAAESDPSFFQSVMMKFARNAIQKHFTRQHLSPEEAGDMANRAKVKSLVLTHNALPDALLDEAKKRIEGRYKGPVKFASDLQIF